ncbi:hypothetical protein QFC20_001442 [Naganishia adeliensis]|uniref:Uncharacterized protein n=1 Tax=Naganishia adeliensis TaxID=92952 RepID=A0ACC2WSW3_9TREE|nr:hypothetical protein QFC20_001442 [Naganishia adeliensis]
MYSTATLFLVLAALAQSSTAAPVHQLAQGGQCLSVPNPSDGATVTLAACNSANNNQATTTNQQWVIQEGNNQRVQLFGTDLCLDAQIDPAPGRPTVVYPCIGSGPQTWYLTPDDRIAITGGTQCLTAAGSNAETQNCAPGINSQAFAPTLLFDTDTASSSAASASSTASSTNGGGIIGGGVGSATSSVASATSQVASSASSAAGQLSSSLASVSSSISSAVAGASQSASSAVSAATASTSSAIAGAGNSAPQPSLELPRWPGASSGASAAGSQATGGVGSATQAVGSGVSAATSAAGAATSAATSGSGSSLPNFGLPAVVSIFGIAIGAAML